MSVRFGATSSLSSKKSSKSNGSQTTATTSTSSISTQSSCCSSNSCSSTSSSSSNQNSQTLSPCPSASVSSSSTTQNAFSLTADKTEQNCNQIQREIHDESTDDEPEVTEIAQNVEKSCDTKPNGSAFTQIVDQFQPQREIIRPKYVVSYQSMPLDVYKGVNIMPCF